MRFDKLTLKGQEALSEAQSLATSRGHSQIGAAHLLRALLDQPEGAVVPILQKLGVALEPLRQGLEAQLARLPKVSGGSQPTLSPALSRALDAAFRAPGAMRCVVDYPRGPLAGRELLENRVVDITIHTWDLAPAIDADDTLHERLVRRCLSARVFQARTGRHAAANDVPGSAPENARLQRRLLRASGRSPS